MVPWTALDFHTVRKHLIYRNEHRGVPNCELLLKDVEGKQDFYPIAELEIAENTCGHHLKSYIPDRGLG